MPDSQKPLPDQLHIRDDLRGVLRGEVLFDDISRSLYATDANLETVTEIGPDGSYRRLLELPASNRVLIALAPAADGSLWLAEYGPYPHLPSSSKVDRRGFRACSGDSTPSTRACVARCRG